MRLVGWLPFDLIPPLVHGWLQGGHSIAYCSISLFVPLRLGMAVCISWCVDSGIQQVTLCQTHLIADAVQFPCEASIITSYK
jgi:hypothetical protein